MRFDFSETEFRGWTNGAWLTPCAWAPTDDVGLYPERLDSVQGKLVREVL